MVSTQIKKILIIDGHDEFRRSLINYIKRKIVNVKIFGVSSGDRGIKEALKEHPDIALIDIELEGLRVAASISEKLAQCKSIILTNEGVEVYQKRRRDNSTFVFMDKNKIIEELIPIIERQL